MSLGFGRCHLELWKTVIEIFDYFLMSYRPNRSAVNGKNNHQNMGEYAF